MTFIKLPQLTSEIVDRFWSKVIIQPNGCWEWQAGTRRRGYGIFSIKRVSYVATRLAFKIYYLQDPQDLMVCHTCDYPKCCNPLHLFLGTHEDNVADRDAKLRNHYGDDHWTHKNPARVERGEDRWNSKFNAEKIRDIRDRSAGGQSFKSIARHYQVSSTVIDNIVKRKTWKHID